jgi:hypothetical protein
MIDAECPSPRPGRRPVRRRRVTSSAAAPAVAVVLVLALLLVGLASCSDPSLGPVRVESGDGDRRLEHRPDHG